MLTTRAYVLEIAEQAALGDPTLVVQRIELDDCQDRAFGSNTAEQSRMYRWFTESV